MSKDIWGAQAARASYIAGLSGADYEALREYILEQKIAPGTLTVEEMKAVLFSLGMAGRARDD